MSWLKIDDGFAEDDAVANLSDRAFRLHVIALCYCARKLNDGILDDRGLRVVTAVLTPTRASRWVNELVESGLWIEQEGGGHGIRNYLEYNPSAEEARDYKRKARERMRELRKRKKNKPDGDGERSGEHTDERSDARSGASGSGTPSSPVPSSEIKGLAEPAGDVIDERVLKLLRVCRDGDSGTPAVLRSLLERATEGDVAYAIESARGPGVKSPTRVCVAELRKRIEGRAA